MFEPQKLITVVLAAVLLAPFSYVFWRIATHRSRPEAQVRAELEAALREQRGEQIITNADGGVTLTRVTGVGQVEAIGFFRSTTSWLSFFPHRWVGLLGLFAVACIFACLIVSLFFPGRGTEMSVSDLPTASPAGEAPR
jgi:hypothetical protein